MISAIVTPADKLFIYHFGLGLYLRNNVLTPESELYRLLSLAGIGQKDECPRCSCGVGIKP